MKCLVLDFGGTFLKYGLMDEQAELTEKGQIAAPVGSVGEYVDAVKTLYDRYQSEVSGVAISMPGMLDGDTGHLHSAGAYLHMTGQNVLTLLKDAIPVPVAIENDGKCGALAEAWKGALKDCRDGIAVIIGTGLAGGIIKDGKLHRGANFSAGELSYLLMKPGDYSIQSLIGMHCGMMTFTMRVAAAKGADIAGAEGLTKLMQDKLPEGAEALGVNAPKHHDAPAVDGVQIFKWLDEGDPVVLPIYEDYIKHLAMLLYNLQVVYDPEKIVVGGGVSRQPRLIPDLRAELAKIAPALFFVPVPTVTLDACHFLADANLYGAMKNYLERFLPSLA